MEKKITTGIIIFVLIATALFFLFPTTVAKIPLKPLSDSQVKKYFVESDKDIKTLSLPAIFTNGMVIQRDNTTVIWGTAVPNAIVEVTIQGRSVKTEANINGLWVATLPKLNTSKGETLSVNAANETKILTNVAIGDVWLCGGQSNMAWPVSKTDESNIEKLASIEKENIRFFSVKRSYDLSVHSSFTSEKNTIGNWFTATSDKELLEFSAVCALSAKEIYEKTQVPQGFVASAHATTNIEAWMNLEQLDFFPEYREYISSIYSEENVKNAHGYIKACDKRLIPASHYNTMIFPIINYTYKGVIWYQGESNVKRSDNYAGLLTSLLGEWKLNPADGSINRDLYVIELVSFDEPGDKFSWAAIRHSQNIAVSNQSRAFLIPASDLGDPENVHPLNKVPLVNRLNIRILANSYGLVPDLLTPQVHSVNIKEDSIEVIINAVNESLELSEENEITGFELAATDGVYYPAQITITKNNVILVTSKMVPHPRYIRYRWANVPENGIIIAKNSKMPVLGYSNNPADFKNSTTLKSLTTCN